MPTHFSDEDRSQALTWIQRGRVNITTFSEGNYQVKVSPSARQHFFPFLHLNDEGLLLSGFCSCKSTEAACPHIAAAYLKICSHEGKPLHVRLRHSFWNALTLLAYQRYGPAQRNLKKKQATYEALSVADSLKCTFRALSKTGQTVLKEILSTSETLSEANSLKFSNFSEEEIYLWKIGKPSPQLEYALSFWIELAKWWIQVADSKAPIDILFEGDLIPNAIRITCEHMTLALQLTLSDLEMLIPYLPQVPSPLKTFSLPSQEIAAMKYDPLTQHLHIIKKPLPSHQPQDREKLVSIGSFWLMPHVGFFPKDTDPLLEKDILTQKELHLLLEKQESLLSSFLPLHAEPITAHYSLFFSPHDDLIIEAHLFEKGDLQQKGSCSFGSWVYLPEHGFYKLSNPLFVGSIKKIPKEEVSSFINHNKVFLSQYDGFQTHISTLEPKVHYRLDTKHNLHFTSHFEIFEEPWIDFGEWIYLSGKGFFAKQKQKHTSLLSTPLTIASDHISTFIHGHKEALDQVKDFFSPHTPLESNGLHLVYQNHILIEPQVTFFPSYRDQQVLLFGDYTYVEGEGFCEIPQDKKLPESYNTKRRILKEDESFFIHYELPTLKSYILNLPIPLTLPDTQALFVASLEEEDQQKQTRWKISLFYQTNLGKVSLKTLFDAYAAHQRYVLTDAGLIFLKQPCFFFFKSLKQDNWNEDGSLSISTLDWMRLSLFDAITPPEGASDQEVKTRQLLLSFSTFQTTRSPDLSFLKSTLRPYQITGVQWLWFLYLYGLSGLLCDEMGLGKTHQAMALLAAAYAKDPSQKHLIVCPTSVIYHWEELLITFLPHLRVQIFYGLKKTTPFSSGEDLLLTSYGTLRTTTSFLGQIPFAITIFDEIQIAKNPSSQIHKALKMISSRMRLGLTGTPIENNLFELKALFDIILPGYMPSDTLFRDLLNPTNQSLLSKLIYPFLLRRKKQEVLLELPEKIEEIAYCELSSEQKTLYKKYFLAHKENLLNDLESNQAPLTHIFSLLSHLKQICDHPCLITKKYEDFTHHASGKWDLFLQLLQQTRDSGQKLVVFSQYLEMLNIIEAYLKEHHIGFASIRGSTRNRKEQLDAFKNDPHCEVFVASLQAVGVGVDLISASVVIHYDRWWNPAKENQATDRVHRIGQQRGVQVFKMVTKNTIEEHIHHIIEKKLALTQEILTFDQQDHLKTLNRDEILEILHLIEKDL